MRLWKCKLLEIKKIGNEIFENFEMTNLIFI